jgi:membrane-associated phospholipid phosphatase
MFKDFQWRSGLLTGVVTVLAANVIGLLLGFLAEALQGSVDEPVYDATIRAGNTGWTDVVETITKMGNVPQTQIWTAVLALGLATWFFAKGWRWWIPLVVCPLAWIVGRWSQRVLAKIIDRDQDLISLIGTPIGNYPSGGCQRLIVVLGVAAFLVVHYARTSRRTTVLLFSVVGVLGLVEAYARARLAQHWFTDIVGGVIFGWVLLVAIIVTIKAFDPDPPRPQPGREARANRRAAGRSSESASEARARAGRDETR